MFQFVKMFRCWWDRRSWWGFFWILDSPSRCYVQTNTHSSKKTTLNIE